MCYLLQLGPGDLPGPIPRRGGTHWPLTRDALGGEPVRQEVVAVLQADRQVERMTAKLIAYSREPVGAANLYAIWSPVSAGYAQEYALQLPGQFAALRDAFGRSRYWVVGFRQGGTVVFRFTPDRYGPGAP
jgi:hypothetical protein